MTDNVSRHSVLVVDDEPLILSSLQRLLRREFDVLGAHSGPEGLALLGTHDVHVIISDQRMPGMSGTEFLSQIQGAYPDAIALLLTGYADIESVIAAINSGGVYRYLVKPWNPDELVAAVREAGAKYALIAQNRGLTRELLAANAVLEQRVRERTAELAQKNAELEYTRTILEAKQAELIGLNARLELLATTDALTGVQNHRAFQAALESEVARASRYRTPLALLMADVDHFKQYNDTFGHPAGDQILRTVARLLREYSRDTDVVARYGGEEFAILLPNTDRAGALAQAERLRAALATAAWRERAITASFGTAALEPNDRPKAEDVTVGAALIAAADGALYQSKAHGRNCVTGAPPMSERHLVREDHNDGS
jgi:diguanylate cyclase (GGDEF)-like protein